MPSFMHGLYAITDNALINKVDFISNVEKAIIGGAKIIQYRDKSDNKALRLTQATDLLTLCRNHNSTLIINDDIELAYDIGADGVHIGEDDSAIEKARITLGDQAIIGVSCYNRLDLALYAEQQGANYVAFGRFYPSQTKPNATLAQTQLLTEARQQLTLPIVAIGGITPQNGAALIRAGASALAVIHGVFAQKNPTLAAQQYGKLFDLGESNQID